MTTFPTKVQWGQHKKRVSNVVDVVSTSAHPQGRTLSFCSERDAEGGEAKRRERRGENVYLDPYSHIDQSLVEVRLTRDNNDPDLGTRHVSVLLSSHIIDPVGLLSAAWIHSQASLPRHTAVTRHKEGSISTSSALSESPPTTTTTTTYTCLQNHSIN